MSFTFTDGFLVLIQSDNPSVWFKAHKWQQKKFFEAIKLGTMKTMGYPNPLEITESFRHYQYEYEFHIENDWGPCYIKNITTGKKRRILYFEIGNAQKFMDDNSIKCKETEIKISK